MIRLSAPGTVSAALLLFFLALKPAAAPMLPVRSGPVVAQVAVEQTSILPGKPFTAGVSLRMDPGWHVYWRNPGDSGLPTKVAWELPAGFTAGPLQWPVPERFETKGFVTYGYSGQVLLLAVITPPASLPVGHAVTLTANVDWLACTIECTPGKAALGISLPVGPAQPRNDLQWQDTFRSARALVPAVLPAARVSVRADNDRVILRAQGVDVPAGARVVFYPAVAGAINDSAAQSVELSDTGLALRMSRPPGPHALSVFEGVLAVFVQGQARGYEVSASVSPAQSGEAGPSAPPIPGLLLALVLAFAGGILLNLMPCVLPVVSLKVLSFVRQSGGGRGLRHGILFTAGVVASFWLIAGILVALRAGGKLLGWGFQFQDPIVLIITASLFFLIGLNLFGVFEIGSVFTRLGAPLAGARGEAGSFFSGLLATAVATPCTAPFMGSALGYALTHSLPAAFGVFTALALGMSAPYVLLSAFPALVARLPRPGKWMETFKQIMGFPMMAAALWMIFVFSALADSAGVIRLLAALLLSGMGAWIWGRWGGIVRPRMSRITAAILATVLVAGSVGFAVVSVRAAPSPALEGVLPGVRTAAQGAAAWEAWSPEKVAQLRSQGTPVFIDFTAKWCLSCQVNERFALDNPQVAARFKERGVTALLADWTDRNDIIARALSGYGRASIPLYVYYRPGVEEPIFLPEILTPGIVLAALDEAPNPPSTSAP
jgi:thiol:disulfide interchange protein/DsbC/DsbD-like thiol-disulfide interchange protein